MTVFIIIALSAALLLAVVWRWIGLHRRHQKQEESYVGESTIAELRSKELRKKRNSERNV